MYLWKKEWLSEDDIEMIWIASLFHDTWFLISYESNEPYWAKIAKNFLKSMLYPEKKIKKIEKMILATDPNYLHPKNIYEKVIKDADLDNLWREDFLEHWNNLKKELESIKNIKILDPDWQHGSINFLRNHKYYTKTQQRERWAKKEHNTKMLQEMLNELYYEDNSNQSFMHNKA